MYTCLLQVDLGTALLAKAVMAGAYGAFFSVQAVALPWAKALLVFAVHSSIAFYTDRRRRRAFKAGLGARKQHDDQPETCV